MDNDYCTYYSYLLGVVLPGELLHKRPLGDEIDGAAEEACDAGNQKMNLFILVNFLINKPYPYYP